MTGREKKIFVKKSFNDRKDLLILNIIFEFFLTCMIEIEFKFFFVLSELISNDKINTNLILFFENQRIFSYYL